MEEVVNGRGWRSGALVEKRYIPQWYLKITAYAERMLAGLDTLDWPEGIKQQQRNWIGRSEGAEVTFPVAESAEAAITVFTTRPDTLWGATFLVLAPEHPLVAELTTDNQRDAVNAYVTRAGRETEIDRQAEGRDKTGVFTGAFATNPVNGKAVPVWIADYVLMGYGTGAIMAVPAHDQRDFDFARKFGLPIVPVYQEPGSEVSGETMTAATTDKGVLVHSGPFDGLAYSKETVKKVADWLEEAGTGKPVVTYRFRDWLVSRQRYWGVPIPIIHCPTCGEVAVPEDQLPVLLPDVENYQPTGTGRRAAGGNQRSLLKRTALSVMGRRGVRRIRWRARPARRGISCASPIRTMPTRRSPAKPPITGCRWTPMSAGRNTQSGT